MVKVDKKKEYHFLYNEIEYAVQFLQYGKYKSKQGGSVERGKWVHIEKIVQFLQKRYPDKWTSSTILRRTNELPKMGRLSSHPSIKGMYGVVGK